MRLGDLPIEVDWAICYGDNGFDQRIRWHVLGNGAAGITQAGWSLSLAFDEVGDETSSKRSGRVDGFGDFAWSKDANATVAIAYRKSSAANEVSREFGPGFVSWRSYEPRAGQTWAPGVYEGGAYRVATSPRAESAEFARSVSIDFNARDEPCAF
jgi:hypothetical protein